MTDPEKVLQKQQNETIVVQQNEEVQVQVSQQDMQVQVSQQDMQVSQQEEELQAEHINAEELDLSQVQAQKEHSIGQRVRIRRSKMNLAKQTPFESLKILRTELISDTDSASESFEKVRTAMTEFVRRMDDGDESDFKRGEALYELRDSAMTYFNTHRRNPYSQKGQRRKEWIHQIIHLTQEAMVSKTISEKIRDAALERLFTDKTKNGFSSMHAQIFFKDQLRKDNMETEGDEYAFMRRYYSKKVLADDPNAVPEVKTRIQELEYGDFMWTLGTLNIGQVEFGENGLQIINNKRSQAAKSGDPSVQNVKVRQRFLQVTIEKMGTHATAGSILRLREILGLDGKADATKPLSRKAIQEVALMVNERTSKVSELVKHKPLYMAATGEQSIADEVDALFGKTAENSRMQPASRFIATKAERKMEKTRILEILHEAGKTGMKVPKLSKHQMDNLVKNNYALLRDEVYDVVNQIYQSAAHLHNNKGTLIYYVITADKADRQASIDRLMARITAKCIARMTAESERGRALAHAEVQELIKEIVFDQSNKEKFYMEDPEAVAASLTKEEYENLYGGGLAAGGSAGLTEAYRKKEGKRYREDDGETNARLEKLKTLSDTLLKIADLREKAFYKGLNEREADALREAGILVQRMLTAEQDLQDLQLVAGKLKNTRFASGLKEVVARVNSGFDFAQITEKMARTMTVAGEVQDEKKEQGFGKLEQELLADRLEEQEKEEERTLLDRMPLKEKEIVSVLMMRLSLSAHLKRMEEEAAKHKKSEQELQKFRKYAEDFKEAFRILRSFRTEEGARLEKVALGKEELQLIRNEDGSIEAVVNRGAAVLLPYSAKMISARMEVDIVKNEALFGHELVGEILQDLVAVKKLNDPMKLFPYRQLMLEYIKAKINLNAAVFNNISTNTLVDYVRSIHNSTAAPEEMARLIKGEILPVENADLINGSEVLELHEKMIEAQEEVQQKVILQKPAEAEREAEEQTWTAGEQAVINMVSDIIFTTETWVSDENLAKPGKRMQHVLNKHFDTIVEIITNKALLDSVLEKMPLSSMQDGGEDAVGIKEKIRAVFEGFIPEEAKPVLKSIENFREKEEQAVREKKPQIEEMMKKMRLNFTKKVADGIRAAFEQEEFAEQCAAMEEEINAFVNEATDGLQQKIREATAQVFGDEDEGEQQEPQQNEVQGNRRKTVEQMRQEGRMLNQIIEDSMSGKRGYGLFTKNVLNGYFSSVSTMDKRAMIASAFRNAKPGQKLPEEASQEEREKAMEREAGNYLGGILKGAGPLLQKMLQGLPVENMPEILQNALKDMKSRLAPIPEDIVKEQLWGIVERSNGSITKVELLQSLGAASVGQAFLCRLHGPKMGRKGKEVVVKILRPDVRNRMMREKEFMLQMAEQTNPGMVATYLGQLQRIEEELDLSLEAENVEAGRVYDQVNGSVKSMKTEAAVDPTANVLVAERAEGETVDRYMENNKAVYRNIMDDLYGKEGRRNPEELKISSYNAGKAAESRMKMVNMLSGLLRRQKMLIELGKQWVREGIFGQGFYHGDLHGGNIVVDDDKLTVIDFGNATKLSESQRVELTRIVVASAVGDVDSFLSAFHHMLENTPEAEFKARERELKAEFEKILKLGNLHYAGQRLFAALLKAQELGFELPPSVFNFSQAQVRLNNTIEEMNSMISSLQSQISVLNKEIKNPSGEFGAEDLFAAEMQAAKEQKVSFEDYAENRMEKLKAYDASREDTPKEIFAGFKMRIHREATYLGIYGKGAWVKADKKEFCLTRMTEGYFSGQEAQIEESDYEKIGSGEYISYLDILLKAQDMVQKKLEEGPADEDGRAMVDKLLEMHAFLFADQVDDFVEIDRKLEEGAAAPAEKGDLIREAMEGLKAAVERHLQNRAATSAYISESKKSGKEDAELAKDEVCRKGILEAERLSAQRNLMKDPAIRERMELFRSKERREQLREKMKPWFEDKENLGAEMELAFRELCDAQDHNVRAVRVKLNHFFFLYQEALYNRLADTRGRWNYHYNREILSEEPDNFIDIMCDLVQTNLSQATSRLGLANSISYVNQLNSQMNELNEIEEEELRRKAELKKNAQAPQE